MTRPCIKVYLDDDDLLIWAKKQKRGEVSRMLKEFLERQMKADPDTPELATIQMQLDEIQGGLDVKAQERKKEREKSVADAKKRLDKAEKLLEDAMNCVNAQEFERAEVLGRRAFKLGMTLKRLKDALPPFIFKKIRDPRRSE